MKDVLICLILLGILILCGCQGVDLSQVSDADLNRISDKLVTCNSPYIRFGTGCCLDKNNNSMCDDDEKINKTVIVDRNTKSDSDTQLKECVYYDPKYRIYKSYNLMPIICNTEKDCYAFFESNEGFNNVDLIDFECKETKLVKIIDGDTSFQCETKYDCLIAMGYYDALEENFESLSNEDKMIIKALKSGTWCKDGFCKSTEGLSNFLFCEEKETMANIQAYSINNCGDGICQFDETCYDCIIDCGECVDNLDNSDESFVIDDEEKSEDNFEYDIVSIESEIKNKGTGAEYGKIESVTVSLLPSRDINNLRIKVFIYDEQTEDLVSLERASWCFFDAAKKNKLFEEPVVLKSGSFKDISIPKIVKVEFWENDGEILIGSVEKEFWIE